MILLADSTDPTKLSPEEAVGQIDIPPGTEEITNAAQTPNPGSIGVIHFLSMMMVLLTAIAGIWVLFNLVMAGYIYVSSNGDAGAHDKVRNQIMNSVIGLILIVVTYLIGGLLGLIFFGNASYILDPVLPTP